MIKNEKQYQLTKKLASQFEESISNLTNNDEQALNDLQKFQLGALRSQFEDLKNQIQLYESLRSGHLCTIEINTFQDIYKVLIQGRIVRGWTQKELGEKLNLKEQQIQRWESNDYQSASLDTIYEILDVIGIDINLGRVSLIKSTFNLPPSVDVEKLSKASDTVVQRKRLFSPC